MQDHIDVSPAALRAEVPPVSERFAAVQFGTATVIFDEDETDRWILSDAVVDRDEMR